MAAAGVYFWARKLKSRDIDIVIDQPNFYRLQPELTNRRHLVKRDVRLMKFEALMGGVQVDIYTPFMGKLVVPCVDVFDQGLYSLIKGFKVAVPEVLLLLKGGGRD